MRSSHVASLDGLRALAVLAVMYYHSRLPLFHFGWIGVDLFFVLSGFLITTLLVKEHRTTRRISLLKFWGRRFLRLMPAYWLFVGTCTVLILRGVGSIDPAGGWSARLYIASLWGYFNNYAPQNVWTYQDISGPLWSLAVEEQFYFVWPFLCAITFAVTRKPWIVAWLLVAATLVCRHLTTNDFVMHTMLYTRGICIIAGCAVALTLAQPMPRPIAVAIRSGLFRWAIAVACLIFFAVGTHYIRKWGPDDLDVVHRIFVPIAAALFSVLVALLWYGPHDRLARGLSGAPLVYIGRISYGIYLYHALFKWLVWDKYPNLTESFGWSLKISMRVLAYFGGTIAFASLSYYLVERPFLKLKDRLR